MLSKFDNGQFSGIQDEHQNILKANVPKASNLTIDLSGEQDKASFVFNATNGNREVLLVEVRNGKLFIKRV